VIRGHVTDPQLPQGPIDAVLIANTYHELAAPNAVLKALFTSMRPGARLVVLDRAVRERTSFARPTAHGIAMRVANQEIQQAGFEAISKDDRFVDRSQDDDVWWLMVFRKPVSAT
jgi:hypothetical protein